MKIAFLFGVGIIPGLGVAGIISRYYQQNEISGRWAFLGIDTKLERDLARRLMKTWGKKMILKYKEEKSIQIESIFEKLISIYPVKLPGKLHLLRTEEHILNVFPTGDTFISLGAVKNLSDSEIANILAHELAHLKLSHAQEHIGYSKPVTLFTA